MKRLTAEILSFILMLCALASCSDRGFDKSMLQDDTVGLQVGKRPVFEYDPQNTQMAFNRGRKEFRVGTDNMSDYFVLKLKSLPRAEGDVVSGSLIWTTSDDTIEYQSLDFKVMKYRAPDTWWLWCAKQKISLVVKELD